VDRKVRLELRHTKIPIKILDLEDQAMSTPGGVVNGLSPTLQYWNTLKSLVIFTGKPIETRPGPEK
jgi:hypothetical protein